jgi:hypothetical protein
MSLKPAMIALLLLAPAAPGAAFAPDKPKAHANPMICRDLQATGSRLATNRVCMTKDQWENARRETQNAVMYGQNRLIRPCPPNTRC